MQEDKEVRDRVRAAGEDKMSAEHTRLQGPSQEEVQKVRGEVGLSPEEVEEINKPKTADQGVALNRTVERVVNVAATLATAAGGVGLASLSQDALKNTPSPLIQEQRPDPKRDNPPQGVVFGKVDGRADTPQPVNKLDAPVAAAPVTDAPVPDAPVEGPMNVVTTIHMPAMFKGAARPPYQAQEVKEPETPLYLREFGAPERGVVMRNKVEQGGGNLAYVEMGDPELWNNLMYLRETYGRPDLKLKITFYSSWRNFYGDPSVPPYRQGENAFVLYWDNWAGDPGIYKNGMRVFGYQEADKTLDFRIVLAETLPGKVPTEDSLNRMHRDFMNDFRSVFLSQENGKLTPGFGLRDSPEELDMSNHPVVVTTRSGAAPPNHFNVSRSGLWIKLE